LRLPRPIAAVVARVRAFGRRVQAAVIYLSLIGIYLAALGCARAWATLFHGDLLGRGDGAPRWLPPNTPTFDLEESTRQS
jgi:hypothetical protein